MKPDNSKSHDVFCSFVDNELEGLSSFSVYWTCETRDMIKLFKSIDLSSVDSILADSYSHVGPKPRCPSDMIRSELLAVFLKISSITQWVVKMRENPLYAILSGFRPGDTPGVGTFYDFHKRLWNSKNKNVSEKIQKFRSKKVKKPKGKGQKADSIESETVGVLIERLKGEKHLLSSEVFSNLLSIFKSVALDHSVETGLMDKSAMVVSGDGTPVVTSSRSRIHHTCDCIQKGITNCTCDRLYSQPDTDIGWDSSRDRYYSGYDMYVLVDTSNDLPLFPLLHPGSKHDSHGFIEAIVRQQAYLPDFQIGKILLDSAHDAMDIYSYMDELGIEPFIDLNAGRGKKKSESSENITVNPEAIPICPCGLEMKRNGEDKKRQTIKFICPKMEKRTECTCESPCTTAKYGKTFSVVAKDNIRLFTKTPRNTREWQQIYNGRTASERSNKREKNDFRLEDGHFRSSREWYVRVYLIMILQHATAWQRKAKEESK